MPIFDISVPICASMAVWPGDPPVTLTPDKSLARHGYAVTRISLGSHTGTHIDAPQHLIPDGLSLDRVPLDTLIGKAFVFDVSPREGDALDASDLSTLGIPRDAERVLLKTSNSDFWAMAPQQFEQKYVHLTKQAASWLAQRGVKLVGIDYMSVDPFPGDGAPAHIELLQAGIVILEGLDLSNVTPGVYQLVALPVKVDAPDGAPVRAVLMR